MPIREFGNKAFQTDDVVAVDLISGAPNWELKVYLRGGHVIEIKSSSTEAEHFAKSWKLA